MDVATAAADTRERQEGERASTERDTEEIAQTVRLLAEEAAIRGSLVREEKRSTIQVSPSVALAGSEPAKKPRGRPRKHPLPDPSAPKRPRGRPRKNPVIQSPVPIVPVRSTASMALTAGAVQSTSLAATPAQQVSTAVHLFQPKAGSSGVQVVSDPARVYVACVGTSAPVAVPVSLMPDNPGLAQLLTAEPAFPLPQPHPLPVVVQSNGGKSKDGGDNVGVISTSRLTSTQSGQTKKRKEGGVVPTVPVTMATSTPQVAGVANLPSPVISPLTPTKRPRGRPRKHPRPDTAPNTHPPPPPVVSQLPATTPEKRPRGRPRKTPLVQAQPVSESVEKVIEGAKHEKLREGDDQLTPPPAKRPRGRPKKSSLTTPTSTANEKSIQSPAKRPRGRPRKHPLPVQPTAQASSTDVPVPANSAPQQPAKRPRGRPRKHPLPTSSQSDGESMPSSGEAGTSPPAKRPRGRPKKQVATESMASQGAAGSDTPSPVKKRRGRPPKHPKPPLDPAPPSQGQPLPSTNKASPSGGVIDKPTGQMGSPSVLKQAGRRHRKTALTSQPQLLPLSVPSKPGQPSSSVGHPSSSATHEVTASRPGQGGELDTTDRSEGHSDGGLQLAFSDDSSESEGEERAKMLSALAKRVCAEERPGGVAKPDNEGEEVDVMKYSPPLEPQFEESFDDDSSCSDHSTH